MNLNFATTSDTEGLISETHIHHSAFTVAQKNRWL